MRLQKESAGIRSLSRELACENSLFKVFFDRIRGSRAVIENYLVVDPKRKSGNLISGVGILPVLGSRIGLIKIFRHAIRGWSWEIPRGFVDSGEKAVVAAIRELNEEMGLLCSPKNMRSLGFLTPDAGILAARLHLFVATHCEVNKRFVSNELGHSEVRFFDPIQIETMIQASRIEDPSTLVAFYKYSKWIKNQY